ncbi:MAG TPA: glycosyltransferase [Dissulfurispiraceae bacterium]|nr:glycosyltransferase [Dissulfurispiraceae bacterium]
MIEQYADIAPQGDILLLRKLRDRLKGRSFLHINSTRAGGGVAEILNRMIPILRDLDIDARWEVISGDERFFDITKKIHNALQGRMETIDEDMWQYHLEVNRMNAQNLRLDADAVLIHDPQPLPLIEYKSMGTWLWRCHIDMSSPVRSVWDHLNGFCTKYDAAIFSVPKFTRTLPIDEFIISPSIDPLSDKNRDLSQSEINSTMDNLKIPQDRPIILQVSRFDRFKDPIGVIQAFRMARKYNDCILVLAGSPATDDPEGAMVLSEVQEAVGEDADIHVLMLPPFSDKEINALQRVATVVLQKSLREGFGLTVSETMWKGKPVIGGAVGGIPLQIIHGVTGFLVHSVEGAAFRIRQILNDPETAKKMGDNGREYVRANFLITRQIRDYLSLWYSMENRGANILEL